MGPDLLEISTERLLLREINPGLSDWLFGEAGEREQMRFLGCRDRDELHEQVRRFRDSLVFNARFSYRHWLMVHQAEQVVIGDAGFHTWHVQHGRAELGYGFRQEAWRGRGLMREAVGRILQLGFETMDLYRVEAFVSPHNKPSVALLRHFGFQPEGVLRAHFRANGRPNDAYCMALLRPEWAQRHH